MYTRFFGARMSQPAGSFAGPQLTKLGMSAQRGSRSRNGAPIRAEIEQKSQINNGSVQTSATSSEH